jgi:ribulose-phosphate 3-epimerase
MRISASISTIPQNILKSTVNQLDAAGIYAYHLDSIESREIFYFAQKLRAFTTLPFDLHLITTDPVKYWDEIRNAKIEAITLQLENLNYPLFIPKDLQGKVGVAVLSTTHIKRFATYQKTASWILLMMTTPGISGGKFTPDKFANIIKYRQAYKHLPMYVDGGVTHEIAGVLRLFGVEQIVSGSYLFAQESVEKAVELLNTAAPLTWLVKDIMATGTEHFTTSEMTYGVLPSTLFISSKSEISDISHQSQWFTAMEQVLSYAEVNGSAVFINQDMPVSELIHLLKEFEAPSPYFFAVNEQQEITGSLFIQPYKFP